MNNISQTEYEGPIYDQVMTLGKITPAQEKHYTEREKHSLYNIVKKNNGFTLWYPASFWQLKDNGSHRSSFSAIYFYEQPKKRLRQCPNICIIVPRSSLFSHYSHRFLIRIQFLQSGTRCDHPTTGCNFALTTLYPSIKNIRWLVQDPPPLESATLA